jgi:hypothetical protein
MPNNQMNVGGDIHCSSIAIGDGTIAGSVNSKESARELVMSLLDRFIIEIKKCDARTPGAISIQTDAAAIRREVASPEPDKGLILRLLNQIESWLGNAGTKIIQAGALADAVNSIRSAIGHL